MEMPDYDTMDRSRLIEEMKRLRREEADIEAEVARMASAALAPLRLELQTVRELLMLKNIGAANDIKRDAMKRYATKPADKWIA